MRQGVFGACEFGLLFERFSLRRQFEELQKMADFGVFAKLVIASELPALLEPRLPAQCCPMIAL